MGKSIGKANAPKGGVISENGTKLSESSTLYFKTYVDTFEQLPHKESFR